MSDQRADDVLTAALASPITVVDTGNNYGDSERRIGLALRRLGGLPADRLLVTKVDPLPGSSNFSGTRVRESLQESMDRLGIDHFPAGSLP